MCDPEYAQSCWSPWRKKDIEALEGVQERMVRMIFNLKGRTYEERLRELNLLTLAERRKRGDMIMTWKVQNGYVPGINHSDLFNKIEGRQGEGTREAMGY